MRYYRLDFDIIDGKAKANISFLVPKNKINSNHSNELFPINGTLYYSSLNKNYKGSTFDRINADMFGSIFSIQELYEFKNQVQYLEKKLEKERKTIKKLKDVIDYLQDSKKFKRVVYDDREQSFVPINKLKTEDYQRYNGFTENNDLVISIITNKDFTKAEKELKNNAKKRLENSYKREKELLKDFIENGYVQRKINAKKPNIKKIW